VDPIDRVREAVEAALEDPAVDLERLAQVLKDAKRAALYRWAGESNRAHGNVEQADRMKALAYKTLWRI